MTWIRTALYCLPGAIVIVLLVGWWAEVLVIAAGFAIPYGAHRFGRWREGRVVREIERNRARAR